MSSNITPFGGVIPILKTVKDFRIPQTIDKILGSRLKQSKYKKSDIIISWLMTNFCGGQRLDHITQHRKNLLIINKMKIKIPSHDTLGRVFKKLATKTITKWSGSKYKKGSIGYYNYNMLLNKLLIEITRRTKILDENKYHTIDMDATFIPSNCYEANYSQYEKGFHPMVCSIGILPIFISMRSGNVSPQTESTYCLKKAIQFAKESKYKIGKVRTDSGSYSKEVFHYLDEQNIKFYIGGKNSKAIIKKLVECNHWKEITIKTSAENFNCEETSICHKLKDDKREYRIVAIRRLKNNNDKTKKWIDGGKYEYRLVITNDYEMPSKELIEFYNKRGTFEQGFHNLKKHHGWKYMPFSKLNENHVFVLISAMANNIYQGYLKILSDKLPQYKKVLTMRLNKFIKSFINTVCTYKNGKFIFSDLDLDFQKIV